MVAGTGPAGAVMACLLARAGVSVCIAGRPGRRAVPDGETLPPEFNSCARSLALTEALVKSHPLPCPGTVSRWGAPLDVTRDFLRNAHGMGWHLDRLRFDNELLREAMNAGAEICEGTPRIFRCGGLWAGRNVTARFLVDATGRSGHVRNLDSGRRIIDLQMAYVARLRQAQHSVTDLRTYIESAPDGWWYRARVPNGEEITAFYTNIENFRRFRHSRTTPTASFDRGRAGGCIVSAHWAAVPCAIRSSLTGPGWACLGDAASSYDPISGAGILKAFRHAAVLAEALTGSESVRDGRLRNYERMVREEFEEHLRERARCYRMEQRWMESEYWGGRTTQR